MIDHCRQMLCARAPEWGLPKEGEWNVLVHNNYQPTCSTFNLLWFHDGDPFPRAVTKILRCGGQVLAREFRSLQAVHQLAPRYVPRPIHLEQVDEFAMLWMEGVPGHRISSSRGYSASILTEAVDMLTSIHRAVGNVGGHAAEDRHTRMVLCPLKAALECGGPAVRDGCIALLDRATTEWLRTLPVVPQHGDLFVDNILRHRQESHIVDWDAYGDIDFPFHDVITLLLSALRATAGTPQRWDPALKARVAILMRRYADGLQLEPSLVSLLLPLALANQLYLHCEQVQQRAFRMARTPARFQRRLLAGLAPGGASPPGPDARQAAPGLIEFVRAMEGPRGAAAVMYSELEHYFENIAYWRGVFLGE